MARLTAPIATRIAANALVFGSPSMPNWSITRIASSFSFAVSAERSAIRRIFFGSFWSYERGCGPNTTPPPL